MIQIILQYRYYSKRMHNNRELELQSINRTLQNKLQALKRELAQKDQRLKMLEALKTDKSVIEEKDKTIQFLMNSIKKLKEDNSKHQIYKMAQLADDYNQSETINKQLKTSNTNLQQQLAQQKEHYQKILAHKETDLKQTKLTCEALQKQRKKWLQEAQKLNKFYAQSLRRQPEREQTLLWVDKLIQFMTKASEIVITEKKQRNQTVQNIKKNLKEQFYQINNLLTRNEIQLANQKGNFLRQLQMILESAEQDCKTMFKSNEEFWQNLNRVKLKEQKESLSKLQQQFEFYRSEKQKQLQELSETINVSQKQKKSLLVSIQQMKSYYQLREKALKQQADMLKQTISDLIESQQLREKQFQKEIQRLGKQIQNLTVRFYQKIQLPINSVYSKIKEEVQKFKNHFQSFFSGNNLQTQIKQFQSKIVNYLIHLNQHKGLRELMKESMQECLKITQFLKPHEKVNFQKGYSSVQNSIIGTYSSIVYQSGISVQTNRQKQLKMNYELATVKKQLQKMKQYVKQLEKKSGPKGSSLMNSKYVQLMAQNQVYKQRIQKLQRNEKDGFVYGHQVMQESRIGRINSAILERLVEKCEHILLFTDKQEKYILEMSNCINSLNLIIINPLEAFQNLVKQIKNVSSLAIVPPVDIKPAQKFVNFDFQRKKELFKEITSKKNEAASNIQKSNLQLTKTIRQFLSKNSSRTNKDSEQKQPEKFKSYESRQMLQKRLKQAHNHRLKNRQDFMLNLRQLQQKVKIIETRYSKRQNISFMKFEESILKSIEQLGKVTEPKQKFKQTKKIVDQALLDVKSKLQNCKIENEGLIREIEMLKLIKSGDKPLTMSK